MFRPGHSTTIEASSALLPVFAAGSLSATTATAFSSSPQFPCVVSYPMRIVRACSVPASSSSSEQVIHCWPMTALVEQSIPSASSSCQIVPAGRVSVTSTS
jgi:hypothetical protein